MERPPVQRLHGPSRALRLLFLLLPALSLALLAGCASIRLNQAMEIVNDRRVELFFDIETAPPSRIRRSVRALMEALSEPAIDEARPEPEYQELLQATRETASRIYTQATSPDREPLLALRSRLYSTCEACHDRFRR